MNGRAPRIAAVVVTAALLGGAAPAVAVGARTVAQRTNPADPVQAAEPAWMRALRIRSEGLNRIYGLGGGKHRPETRATAPGPHAATRSPRPAHLTQPSWPRCARSRSEAKR
jgi:hypothetical protein